MRFVIIADIHDNLVNLEKCLAWADSHGIESLICCGDLTNSETLDFLAKHFKKQIYLVNGNGEIFHEEEAGAYANIRYGGRKGAREAIGDKFFGFCHEPFLVQEVMELGLCDIIFYGHTHKPWIEKKKGIDLVNPGTLGGVFTKATFAVWDSVSGDLELKILELL